MRPPLHVEDGLAVPQVVLVHVGAEIIHGQIIVVGLASDDPVSEWLRNANYECDEQHPQAGPTVLGMHAWKRWKQKKELYHLLFFVFQNDDDICCYS